MSGSLVAACLIVLAATVTAVLPMRRQFLPGIVLLILAPVILIWLGAEHGWLWLLVGLAAFVSMFRRPLLALARYFGGRGGRRPETGRGSDGVAVVGDSGPAHRDRARSDPDGSDGAGGSDGGAGGDGGGGGGD